MSKKTKQQWLIKRQRLTKARSNFVKQKQAEVKPKGRTLKEKNEACRKMARQTPKISDARYKYLYDGNPTQDPT